MNQRFSQKSKRKLDEYKKNWLFYILLAVKCILFLHHINGTKRARFKGGERAFNTKWTRRRLSSCCLNDALLLSSCWPAIWEIKHTDPLAEQKSIRLEQLQNRNFILEPVKSRPYQLCLLLCQAAGFNPKVIYTDHYIENITAFVKKDLGVSLLMGKVIPADPELKAIPVLPNTTAKITVCYLPKVVPNSGQEALLKYLQHYCRSLKIEQTQ